MAKKGLRAVYDLRFTDGNPVVVDFLDKYVQSTYGDLVVARAVGRAAMVIWPDVKYQVRGRDLVSGHTWGVRIVLPSKRFLR